MKHRSMYLLVLLTMQVDFAPELIQSVVGSDETDQPIACAVQVDSVLNGRFPPTNLFDGQQLEPTSRWASSRADVPHWVLIELDRSVTLDGMVVHGHDDAKGLALADAVVQLPDGDTWKTLAAVRDNRQARVEFEWTAVETSVIRLLITRPCRFDHTVRLFEIVLCRGHTPITLQVRHRNSGSPEAQPKSGRVDDGRLLSAVARFDFGRFEARRYGQRNQALLQQYYDSVLLWSRMLGERFQAVPGHADWGYYGDGGDKENSVRPICYAAFTNAFLAEIEAPAGGASQCEREQMRQQAIAALAYLTHAHQANGGTCLNGRAWGNQWQSAMWARSLGMAGWLLWERLDRTNRLAVARVIEFEADRFLNTKPKNSLRNDTGAEENAWNAGLIALARCMLPDHPRANQWDVAAKTYMYNTFSIAADVNDRSSGDDGRPICDWVATVNAHPDFTVENHGLVHVGYLKNAHALLLEAASPYAMTTIPLPQAGRHHANDVFEVLLKCVAWEGAPIYFGGNDWKLVHTQCSDVISFALTNVFLHDARAAFLESVALDWLCRIQKRRGGYYTVRKDLEHNGFVASRLATCYLVHAQSGEGTQPITERQFEDTVTGVTRLDHGKAILHRTPGKFASFAWGRQRLALVLPRGGNWVVWPHYSSYLGLINGEDASQRNAELIGLYEDVHPNHFTVGGTLQRNDGKVTQDFALASLEKDIVVYIERLRIADGCRIDSRETGVVGHEYPLESNRREIFGRFGREELIGVGNLEAVRELETNWLNLGGRVGYVVRREEGRRNLMRYHDLAAGHGRVPKLQEWFSLVGDATAPSSVNGDDWACVVTFLNQTPNETAQWAEQVRFDVDHHVATCHLGDDTIRADFAAFKTSVTEIRP